MSPQETVYFWTWYKTGFGKSGRRSYKRAASILHKSIKTLVELAEESNPTWLELAAEKDAELAQRIDEAAIDGILSDRKQIETRQRTVIAELFTKARKAIEDGDISFTVDGLIKLFEYEKNFGRATTSGAGEALAGILQFVGSEVRSELHRAVRESRLQGNHDLLRPGMEPSSSN